MYPPRAAFRIGLVGKNEELFIVCIKELMKAVDILQNEMTVGLLKEFVKSGTINVMRYCMDIAAS